MDADAPTLFFDSQVALATGEWTGLYLPSVINERLFEFGEPRSWVLYCNRTHEEHLVTYLAPDTFEVGTGRNVSSERHLLEALQAIPDYLFSADPEITGDCLPVLLTTTVVPEESQRLCCWHCRCAIRESYVAESADVLAFCHLAACFDEATTGLMRELIPPHLSLPSALAETYRASARAMRLQPGMRLICSVHDRDRQVGGICVILRRESEGVFACNLHFERPVSVAPGCHLTRRVQLTEPGTHRLLEFTSEVAIVLELG